MASNPEVGQDARFHIDSIRNQSLGNAAHRFAARVRGFESIESAGKHWLAVDHATAERRQADHAIRWLVHFVRAIVLVLLVVVSVGVSLRGDEMGQAATFGLACLATLSISPLAWAHYYVFALPVALCLPLWVRKQGHPVTARVLASSLPGLIWIHYVLMSWCGAIGLLGLGTTIWFLVSCSLALAFLSRSIDFRTGVNSSP